MTVWSLTHIRHDSASCILGVYSTAKRARDACDARFPIDSTDASRWTDVISRDRIWRRYTHDGHLFSVTLHVLDKVTT